MSAKGKLGTPTPQKSRSPQPEAKPGPLSKSLVCWLGRSFSPSKVFYVHIQRISRNDAANAPKSGLSVEE